MSDIVIVAINGSDVCYGRQASSREDGVSFVTVQGMISKIKGDV